MTAKDLILSFALIPLGGIFAAVLGLSLDRIARKFGVKLWAPLYGVAIAAGFALAIATLLYLDCALFIDLPFANDWCKLIGF